MVLDCVTIISTTISLLMNGLCCMYQQQEEQKLREAIRDDIRTEFMYHRSQEQQQQQYQQDEEQGMFFRPITTKDEDIYTSLIVTKNESTSLLRDIQDERRHQLIKLKMHHTKEVKRQVGESDDCKNTLKCYHNNSHHTALLNSESKRNDIVPNSISNQFYHDTCRSPFIEYSNIEMDEEIHSIITSSSWTTIPIA